MKTTYIFLATAFFFLSDTSFARILSPPEYAINEADEKIVLLWDASYSANDKNIKKELLFIEAYFQKSKGSEVDLVIFANEIISSTTFKLVNGDVTQLISQLKKVHYDGFPIIPNLKSITKVDRFMLFSDGIFFDKSIYHRFNKPVVAVTSSSKANEVRLNNLAFHTLGHYVNLSKFSIAQGIDLLAPEKIVTRRFVEKKILENSDTVVKGMVTDEERPLKDVNITVKGKSLGTVTDEDGNYSIIAKEGDILIFSFVHRATRKIKVGKKDIINIVMPSNRETLETVVIEADIASEEDLVRTAYGLKNKNAVSITSQTVKGEDLLKGSTNLGQAITGKFSGISFDEPGKLGTLIIRNAKSLSDYMSPDKFSPYPLFVIDGVPLPRSTNTKIQDYSFIDPNNILDVTILKGMASTNRYGSEGATGVVLIQTKSGTFLGNTQNKKEKYIPPKFKKYTGNLQISQITSSSNYRKLFVKNDNKPSYSRYLSEVNTHKNNAAYFFEGSQLFYDAGEHEISERILSNIRGFFNEDIRALRSLALVYRSRNNETKALETYKNILNLNPKEAQNYLDVAITSGKSGNYTEAIDLFNDYMKRPLSDFSAIENRATVAFKSLLSHRDGSWNTSQVNKKYLMAVQFDLRVELDWSTYDARFKVYFIKPNKDILFWAHNERENSIELTEELIHGITSKQINFSNAEKGMWYFLIDDIPENNSKIPNYLIITIYSNYGMPNQIKIDQLIELIPQNNGKIFGKILLKD